MKKRPKLSSSTRATNDGWGAAKQGGQDSLAVFEVRMVVPSSYHHQACFPHLYHHRYHIPNRFPFAAVRR